MVAKLPKMAKPAKAAKAPTKPRKAKAAPAAPVVAEPEAPVEVVVDANTTYDDIRAAFDHFNATLFGGDLMAPLFTFRAYRGERGRFSPDRFTAHGGEVTVPEIALNPETFTGRTVAEIMSTLVHEMAHLWDDLYGAPGGPPYHSKSWGTKMLACGLQPCNAKGEDMTAGPSLTHYIPEDARGDVFRAAMASLPREVSLWADAFASPDIAPRSPAAAKQREQKVKRAEAQKASKTKFVCPSCAQAAWAKPTALLACYPCSDAQARPVAMVCS